MQRASCADGAAGRDAGSGAAARRSRARSLHAPPRRPRRRAGGRRATRPRPSHRPRCASPATSRRPPRPASAGGRRPAPAPRRPAIRGLEHRCGARRGRARRPCGTAARVPARSAGRAGRRHQDAAASREGAAPATRPCARLLHALRGETSPVVRLARLGFGVPPQDQVHSVRRGQRRSAPSRQPFREGLRSRASNASAPSGAARRAGARPASTRPPRPGSHASTLSSR